MTNNENKEVSRNRIRRIIRNIRILDNLKLLLNKNKSEKNKKKKVLMKSNN